MIFMLPILIATVQALQLPAIQKHTSMHFTPRHTINPKAQKGQNLRKSYLSMSWNPGGGGGGMLKTGPAPGGAGGFGKSSGSFGAGAASGGAGGFGKSSGSFGAGAAPGGTGGAFGGSGGGGIPGGMSKGGGETLFSVVLSTDCSYNFHI
jgi:hypothetical protein